MSPKVPKPPTRATIFGRLKPLPNPKPILPPCALPYNPPMPVIFNPHHFAHVPLWLWPVLLLRLVRVVLWTKASGRNVLFTVTPDAQLIIHYVDDDPNDLNGWLYRQAQAPKPHLYPCENAAGLLHLPYILIAVTRMMEATGFMEIWIWVRIVARRLPAIINTS